MALSYTLATSYVGSTFLDGFNFWDSSNSSWGSDPTWGFVQYFNRTAAEEYKLVSVDPQTQRVRLGVDTIRYYDPTGPGRPSVRIESQEKYTHGLIIGDFAHMPSTLCGVWPAFWMYGPDWPNHGEIDIIEGGSNTTMNQITAHTLEGCSIPAEARELNASLVRHTECGKFPAGCSTVPPVNDTASYGMPFNAAGGGVYAMQWDSNFIKTWHFTRSEIPVDILASKPDPSLWGTPQAIFGGSSCEPDRFFGNMSIVLNINMCGALPGGGWGKTDSCPAATGYTTCAEYIGREPAALANAYWDINYIKVFQPSSQPAHTILPHSSDSLELTSTPSTLSTVFASPLGGASVTGTSPVDSTCTGDACTTTSTSTVKTTMTHTVTRAGPSLSPPSFAPTALPAHLPNNKPTIGTFAHLGCLATNGSFAGFAARGTDDPHMTNEKCVKHYCASYRYAATFDSNCFCSDTLTGDVRDVDPSLCDIPCGSGAVSSSYTLSWNDGPNAAIVVSSSASSPTSSPEVCGGFIYDIMADDNPISSSLPSSLDSDPWRVRKREAADSPDRILITVYADVIGEQPPILPPAIGVVSPSDNTSYSSNISSSFSSSFSSSSSSFSFSSSFSSSFPSSFTSSLYSDVSYPSTFSRSSNGSVPVTLSGNATTTTTIISLSVSASVSVAVSTSVVYIPTCNATTSTDTPTDFTSSKPAPSSIADVIPIYPIDSVATTTMTMTTDMPVPDFTTTTMMTSSSMVPVQAAAVKMTGMYGCVTVVALWAVWLGLFSS